MTFPRFQDILPLFVAGRDAALLPMPDWNAAAYHRVSDPQFKWGLRVLDRLVLRGDERAADVGCGTGRLTRELHERLPHGSVVAIDRSPAMVVQAAAHLRDRGIAVVRADAAALPFEKEFDVVFSTATFHWVLDHAALFSSLFTALRPGGRLHAQCGGGPNLARLRTRASDLIRRPPFLEYFQTHWSEPWQYAEPAATEARLLAAGFKRAAASLEPAPVLFPSADEYRAFVDSVCLHPYLNRLPANLHSRFSETLIAAAAADNPPFELDYCRLNISAAT